MKKLSPILFLSLLWISSSFNWKANHVTPLLKTNPWFFVAFTYKIKLPSLLYEPEFFSKAEYEVRTCMQVVYRRSDLRAGGRDGGMWKRKGEKANTKVHWLLPWTPRVPLILHPAGAFWGVSRMPFRIHPNKGKHFLWALSLWWGLP